MRLVRFDDGDRPTLGVVRGDEVVSLATLAPEYPTMLSLIAGGAAGGARAPPASIAIGTGVTYVGIYLPTYAAEQLHVPLASGLAAMTLAQLLSIPITLGVAALVQRAAPIRTMTVSTLVAMAVAWPAFALLHHAPGIAMLGGVRLLLAIIGAPYFALQPVMLGRLFPERLRVTGLASGYTAGIVLFGAFAPLENHWLVHATHNPVAPAFFLLATGIVTLLSLAAASFLERRPAEGAVASATGGMPARS